MKIKMNTNLTSGLLFFVFSIVIWIMIPIDIKTMETTQITARTVPRLVAIVIFLCSIALIIQGIFKKDKEIITIQISKELKSLLLMAIFIIYMLIMPYLGFAISSILFCTGILVFYCIKKWSYYAITYTTVILVYLVFEKLLHVNMP